MNTSLTRSIGFWLLVVLSLASAAVGGWIISGQVATMTTTLLDGTATGIEVYVGQSLVVFGAALVGAGVLGVLLALALIAVQSLIPRPQPVTVEAIDWTARDDAQTTLSADGEDAASDQDAVADAASDQTVDSDDDHSAAPIGSAPRGTESVTAEEAQNGSSGSIATATKINVK